MKRLKIEVGLIATLSSAAGVIATVKEALYYPNPFNESLSWISAMSVAVALAAALISWTMTPNRRSLRVFTTVLLGVTLWNVFLGLTACRGVSGVILCQVQLLKDMETALVATIAVSVLIVLDVFAAAFRRRG